MEYRDKYMVLNDMSDVKYTAKEYDELYKKIAANKEIYAEELRKLYCKSLEIKFEVQSLQMEYAVVTNQYNSQLAGFKDYEKLNLLD